MKVRVLCLYVVRQAIVVKILFVWGWNPPGIG